MGDIFTIFSSFVRPAWSVPAESFCPAWGAKPGSIWVSLCLGFTLWGDGWNDSCVGTWSLDSGPCLLILTHSSPLLFGVQYKWLHTSDSLTVQLVKNPPAMQRPWFDSWVGKIHWRRERLPTPVFLGFPCGSAGKESAYDAGDLVSIPGSRRSPGEEKGYILQYSGLENSMDCIIHGITKSRTLLSDFHFHFHLDSCLPGSTIYY